MIATGFEWRTARGGSIITSMPDAAAGLTGLGVAEAADVLDLAAGETATWNGQTVDRTTVLVRYTYAGDADLDGGINIDDYGRIDGNVSKSGTVFGWFKGDFNYDGKINIDDYGIIDGNINRQGPLPLDVSTVKPSAASAALAAPPSAWSAFAVAGAREDEDQILPLA